MLSMALFCLSLRLAFEWVLAFFVSWDSVIQMKYKGGRWDSLFGQPTQELKNERSAIFFFIYSFAVGIFLNKNRQWPVKNPLKEKMKMSVKKPVSFPLTSLVSEQRETFFFVQ